MLISWGLCLTNARPSPSHLYICLSIYVWFSHDERAPDTRPPCSRITASALQSRCGHMCMYVLRTHTHTRSGVSTANRPRRPATPRALLASFTFIHIYTRYRLAHYHGLLSWPWPQTRAWSWPMCARHARTIVYGAHGPTKAVRERSSHYAVLCVCVLAAHCGRAYLCVRSQLVCAYTHCVLQRLRPQWYCSNKFSAAEVNAKLFADAWAKSARARKIHHYHRLCRWWL